MLDEALCHAEHSRQHMQRKPLLGSTLLGRSICLQLSTYLSICSAVTQRYKSDHREASHCTDSIDVFAASRTIDEQTSGP